MEIALMNYKFTALLIIMFVCLTLFAKPAYPRNDYLNNYGDRCTYGSVELTLNQYVPEEQQLQTFDGNYNNGNRSLNLRFRKDLGISKRHCDNQNRIKTHNMKLMQQMELNKNCPRINRDTTLQYNANFAELVAYCKNVKGVSSDSKPKDSGSFWDVIKNDYKEENPDITLMGDKFMDDKKKLKIPKYLTDELPVPTNETE
jgi:hypothetical protein